MFLYKIRKLKNAQRLKKSVSYSFTQNKLNLFSYTKINNSGRNIDGSITVRHRGSKFKSNGIKLDYYRYPNVHKFLAISIVKQSNKLPFALLIKTTNLALSYITAPQSIFPGWFGLNVDEINLRNFQIKLGFMCQIKNLKQGDIFFNLINPYNYRFKWARAAGTFAKILYLSQNKDFFAIRIPSGKKMKISLTCRCVLGRNSNILHKWIKYGGAGYIRSLGWRPTVRGVAMNPVDHPHGGRTKTSQPELSPWGWVAKRGY